MTTRKKEVAVPKQTSVRGMRNWHVGREIPVATILIMILQTAGVIWWAASTAAKVDFLERTAQVALLNQVANDRRQDDDATRSEGRILVQLKELNTKIDKLLDERRK